MKDLVIPNSVTSIGNSAFSGCRGLKSVTIPNSVTSIGDNAFEDCSGLTSVTIPNSVTSIGETAFSNCSGLTSVTIPNSVTSIGYGVFGGCSGLESIVVESGNSKYDSRDNCNAIIETATITLLAGCKNTTIPNSVTSICFAAFQYCSGLTSVSIPNSVTEIGSYAFSDCSGLTTIFYNAENCANFSYNKEVFNYGTNIIIGKDVKKVPDYLFYSLKNAPTSVISKSITPPSCGKNTFKSSAYKTAKLYVPSGAIADYKAAKVWKKFTKIEGIETNDAENVAD